MKLGDTLFSIRYKMVGEYTTGGRPPYEIALNLIDKDVDRDVIWCDIRDCRPATEEEIKNAAKLNNAAFQYTG